MTLGRSVLGALGTCLLLVAIGCATSAPEAPRGTGGSAQVTFVNPASYTDFTGGGPSGQADQPRMLVDLEHYLRDEAARQLGADRRLEVRVLDIDQGGGTGSGPGRVRVTSGTTSAEMNVEYVLRDPAGKEIDGGKRRLIESATSLAPGESGDPMPLLRRAVHAWLKELGRL